MQHTSPYLALLEIYNSFTCPPSDHGGGDAFFSGFLAGYLEGQSLQTCLQLAAVCGALCVTSRSLAAENLSMQTLYDHLRAGG